MYKLYSGRLKRLPCGCPDCCFEIFLISDKFPYLYHTGKMQSGTADNLLFYLPTNKALASLSAGPHEALCS